MSRVLVIEDNPANLELVTTILEADGYQILTAEAAADGLRVAATERPDLILMDLHLPGMSGYDATRHLKADPATAAIPVVALTARAMRGDDEKAIEAGCNAYLTKPLDAQVLRKTLRRFLGEQSGSVTSPP
jgi:CheY-like chemotaxis protein